MFAHKIFIRQIVVTALLLMVGFIGQGANAPQFKIPDFAYPKTVAKDAQAMLASADESSDPGAIRLTALVQLFAAQTAIDRDSMFAQPAEVERQLACGKLDNASRAMLFALEAKLYTEIYNLNSYKYNRVDAPAAPLPADVSAWSGNQFRTRIIELLDSALAVADTTPLTRYSGAVDYSDDALQYVGTVEAFARYSYYKALSEIAYNTDYKEKKLALCNGGIALATEGSAAKVFWSVEKQRLDDRADFDAWLKLYREFENCEPGRYALDELADRIGGGVSYFNEYGEAPDDTDTAAKMRERRDTVIALLRSSLEKFPRWYDNNSLKNNLNSLTQAKAEIRVPAFVPVGTAFPVELKWSFAKKITIGVYALPRIHARNLSAADIRKSFPRSFVETVVPDSIDGQKTLSMTLPRPGNYAVTLTVDGKESEGRWYEFNASDVLAFVVNGASNAAVVAGDFISGKPIANARVSLVNRNEKSTVLGKTSANGMLVFDSPLRGKQWQPAPSVSILYKGYTYDFDRDLQVSYFNADSESDEREENMLIFTDRNLYHPGDTIGWAVIAYSSLDDGAERRIEKDAELKVTLYNANGETVDSAKVVTDGLGRAYGSFATQKGVLTGNYRIDVESQENEASTYVMVSDYKRPVFEVVVNSVERNMPHNGMVTIMGRARTYSGMPVANADVKTTINGANRWRWFTPAQQLGTLSTTTDADGAFSVVVTDSIYSKYNYSDFIADIVVTTQTAETATASRNFTLGKPYVLEAPADGAIDTDKLYNVTFRAFDANGNNAQLPLTWALAKAKGGEIALSGTATAGKETSIDLSSLAAGSYIFKVAATDTLQADAVEGGVTQLYSIKKNDIGADAPVLFVPETSVMPVGGKITVAVGTPAEKLYVYAFVNIADKLVAVAPTEIKHGFGEVKVQLPEDLAKAGTFTLAAISNGRVYTRNINILKPEKAQTQIVAESFRDRLVPGAPESWRFRILSGETPLANAGFIATMYDKALDALQSGRWPSGFTFPHVYYGLNLDIPNEFMHYLSASIKYEYLNPAVITWPEFRYVSRIYSRGGGLVFASARKMSLVKSESVAVESENIAYDAVAPMEGNVNGILEESVVTGAPTDEDAEPKVDYREGEIPLAFWRPALVADAEGNVDITFTVPNSNTEWQFKGFGWNGELDAATFMAQAVANKPVMVQPNVPRFLRQGDKACVLATVFNNSDDRMSVRAVAEVFNIETGEVVTSSADTLSLAPKGSGIVAIDVTAPAGVSAIGYRVKAIGGNFADGEQAAIPVLTSDATVIESTEFYLNPNDSKPFELTVKPAKNATVTLQYCQNPIWTIVKAMRGLSSKSSLTSTDVVGNLFSALAARHLLATNPDIAKAISVWRANPTEDALTSMLEKNEELKALVLDQTPWVQAAKSQSSRMAMLADLLDTDKVAKTIADCSAALAKMQNSDGGFRWGSWEGAESSEWSTTGVLTTLGLARSLGMLDDSFDAMLQKAFTYLQVKACEPNRPATDESLTLISALLPELKLNTKAQTIVHNTVAYIARNWKKDVTVDKAYDVLILKAKGRSNEAANIMESIRQFAVEKNGMGLCFPNVTDIRGYATIIQAYAAMNAPASELDALRQWITVQAQALDDLGAYNPDYIIAAVMLTGSDWTSVPVSQSVTVNGKALEIAKNESMTGYFSQRLDADGKALKISVTPNGVTPSYGSVVTVFDNAASKVKARPGKDLSIEKRFLVETDGQWGETDKFTLGQRVRVQLVVKAKRNLEYVTITDQRPAAFEPVDQLPGFVWDSTLAFYRENLDSATNLFIGWLPKGTYHVTFDMTAAASGTFVSGIATLQSQYAPELTAHSAGNVIIVEE